MTINSNWILWVRTITTQIRSLWLAHTHALFSTEFLPFLSAHANLLNFTKINAIKVTRHVHFGILSVDRLVMFRIQQIAVTRKMCRISQCIFAIAVDSIRFDSIRFASFRFKYLLNLIAFVRSYVRQMNYCITLLGMSYSQSGRMLGIVTTIIAHYRRMRHTMFSRCWQCHTKPFI